LSACTLRQTPGGNAIGLEAPPLEHSTPISHIVVIVQENRTFNDLFATFPGATGTTTGKMRSGPGSGAKTEPIALKEVPLYDKSDLRHTYPGYKTAYRDGHMDAFNLIRSSSSGRYEGRAPYQYVNPNQVKPYWAMAQQYALANKMFQTQGSGSFTAHQDLIRGGTELGPNRSVIDDPTKLPWGCAAPQGTLTSVITTSGQYEVDRGPFPCFKYDTLQVLLDAKSISWKYYAPGYRNGAGRYWNAFLAISSFYHDTTEWNQHISTPQTNVLTDIAQSQLPAMSWVIPDGQDSDHPAYGGDTGPSWVASVVNAIGESSYWDSTAIVVLWDDWGGFYDPVAPPTLDDQGGPGFRVPMIVISPYVPQGEISNTVYGFGSVVRFIEDTWNLGRLGTTDSTAKSIGGIFNFSQSPRAFQKIGSKYSARYFLSRPPSGLPVDTE